MKAMISCACLFLCACMAGAAPQSPQPAAASQADAAKKACKLEITPASQDFPAKDISPALTKDAIDEVARRIADRQLSSSQAHWDRNHASGAMYAGFMAASQATGDAKYGDAMAAMASDFHYGFRSQTPNPPDPEEQGIAQTYLEIYLRDHMRDKAALEAVRAVFDPIVALPVSQTAGSRIAWRSSRTLFMAPPAWARMYAATGEHKYIDYLNAQWAETYGLLWDKSEQLYAHNVSDRVGPDPNGKSVFELLDQGWAMGGIARTLAYLPKSDPRRSFYIENLRALAVRMAELQNNDGLWCTDLSSGNNSCSADISGSALVIYGMAYGVNEKILDAVRYKPAIERAWRAMIHGSIYADGRLRVGQEPGAAPADDTALLDYDSAVGAFLLAAAELDRMVVPHMPPDQIANVDPVLFDKRHMQIPLNPHLPSIILVGDSTVHNGNGDGAGNQMGWGDALPRFFNLSRINIVNRAAGGRSSRTYLTEGHWTETLKLVKPGDIVIFQFGHNDAAPLDDADRSRGSLNGVGEGSQEIFNPLRGVHETVYSFGHYLDQYVKDVRAKGATPVLCSLVPRNQWKNGRIVRQTDTYRGWTREIALRDHVGFIDLNEMIARKYDAMGRAATELLFGDTGGVHTTLAGAILSAETLVSGLKSLPRHPARNEFSAQGKAVVRFTR